MRFLNQATNQDLLFYRNNNIVNSSNSIQFDYSQMQKFKSSLQDFVTNYVNTYVKTAKNTSKKQFEKVFYSYLANNISICSLVKTQWQHMTVDLYIQKKSEQQKKIELKDKQKQNQHLQGFWNQQAYNALQTILGSLYKRTDSVKKNDKNPYNIRRLKTKFGQYNVSIDKNQLTIYTNDSNKQKIDPIPLYKVQFKEQVVQQVQEQVVNKLSELVNNSFINNTQQIREQLFQAIMKSQTMKKLNFTESLKQQYIDDNVHQGQTFIDNGQQYTWIQSFDQYDTELDNGQHWTIWSAENNDEQLMYFVVDPQTSFIDWGPCQTLQECSDFLFDRYFDDDQDQYQYPDIQQSLNKKLTQEVDNKQSTGFFKSYIIDAINDEWKTVQLYNNIEQTLQNNGYEPLAQVIQDITAEELNHIGMLQQILNTLQNVKQIILGGQDEANKIMNGEQKPK